MPLYEFGRSFLACLTLPYLPNNFGKFFITYFQELFISLGRENYGCIKLHAHPKKCRYPIIILSSWTFPKSTATSHFHYSTCMASSLSHLTSIELKDFFHIHLQELPISLWRENYGCMKLHVHSKKCQYPIIILAGPFQNAQPLFTPTTPRVRVAQ